MVKTVSNAICLWRRYNPSNPRKKKKK
uniref:Uncharacterized protein n=1 Tax=Rhizophora mucronata TaxID=61149 RepID=A0A2P2JD63_RHIMU